MFDRFYQSTHHRQRSGNVEWRDRNESEPQLSRKSGKGCTRADLSCSSDMLSNPVLPLEFDVKTGNLGYLLALIRRFAARRKHEGFARTSISPYRAISTTDQV